VGVGTVNSETIKLPLKALHWINTSALALIVTIGGGALIDGQVAELALL
jgi:hypothetical protein